MRDLSTLLAIEESRSPAPQPHALEVRDLVKTYSGKIRALDGVSFSVEAGSIFALLGPNGAGKSTTVKILNTLSLPDSGQAYVMGIDVLRHPDGVRRSVGWVAQMSGADIAATGRENLSLQGQIYGMHGRVLTERVNALLDQVGLTPDADRPVSTYSGGARRKLDIALSLVHRPRVLFLDEPTSGLDPESRVDIWSELTRLADQEGVTVFLTTHYLEEADRLAKKLAILDKGRIVAEGSPEQLKGEFFGDAVSVDLQQAEPEEMLRSILGELEGIREVAVEPKAVRARAKRGATAVPLMLAVLESHGVRVSSVKVARPSLHDVYLRYAGRVFSEAERGDRK